MSKPLDRRNKIFARCVISVVLAVVTWFYCIPAWQNVRDSYSAASWNSTDGTVVASRSSSAKRPKGGTRTNYVFEYCYAVNGEPYSSQRYSFRVPTGDKRRGIQQHRKGTDVTVFFNAEYPERAVIDRNTGLGWNYFVLLVFAAVAFMFACSLYSNYVKRRRNAALGGE